MVSLAPPNFSTLFHKWHHFRKKILNTKYLFWFYLQLSSSETFLILRRVQRDNIINVHRYSYKYPLSLSCFHETWIFLTDFRKKSSCIKFNKTPSSGSRVVSCRRTEGQRERRTDLAKLQLAFRNSVKLLKIIPSVHTLHFLDCYKFRNQQRLFPMQYSEIFDWQGMCLLRGTNFVFTYIIRL